MTPVIWLRRHWIGLALAGCLFTPTTGSAQAPWTVTLKPTMIPLPIGFCAAVHLTMKDPTTSDVPRNPLSGFVTIADFDMAVTAPDGRSVAGQQVDANHWSVCACQGATVGTVATVTATYPAQSLPAATQVPGVKFQTTATFALGAALGTYNSPECSAISRQAAITGGAPLTKELPPATRSTPPVPATGTPVPAPPVAVPNQTGRAAPVAAPPPGQPPRNIQVGGNPVEASVFWDPPAAQPAPASYVVERWKTSDPACCRATSPTLPPKYSNRWTDLVMWTGPWTYQVTAIYADGRRGSALGTYTYPEPETPKGLKAQQVEKNTVVLTWQPVQGAAYYVVSGPPSNTAIRVDGTSLTRTGVPVGNSTWQVSTMYQGTASGGLQVAGAPPIPQQGSAFATTNLTVVNPHYRLVAEAIRVTTETVDKPFSEDGKYDEIYVASFAELHLRQSPATGGQILLERQPIQLSHIHGDVSFWLPSERVQAGTASGNGGIRGGDIISPIWAAPSGNMLAGSPGFVLWDGELVPGKHDLVLHPMIWEVDQRAAENARDLSGGPCFNLLCGWANFMKGVGGENSAFHAGPQAAIAGTQIAIVEGDKVWMGTTGGGAIHMERHDRDRPIGLEVTSNAPNSMGLVGDWRDKMVILSSEKIEAALASGKSTIEVRFWDHWNLPNIPPGTVNYLNGDYTLVIRIERVP